MRVECDEFEIIPKNKKKIMNFSVNELVLFLMSLVGNNWFKYMYTYDNESWMWGLEFFNDIPLIADMLPIRNRNVINSLKENVYHHHIQPRNVDQT